MSTNDKKENENKSVESKTSKNKTSKNVDKTTALGMVAVSERDRHAMKTIYKSIPNDHSKSISDWLIKFEEDGFSVKNKEDLLKV